MPEPVLHPDTVEWLARCRAQQPHAVVLIAPEGAGKTVVVHSLAAALLKTSIARLSAHPYFMQVAQMKDVIPIEAIRAVHEFAKLRVPGPAAPINRIAYIPAADTMTTPAQNSALKMLEEPPQGMMLLMTASSEQSLLPTIRSRVHLHHLRLPSTHALGEYLRSLAEDEIDVAEALRLSGGLPGLAHAILTSADHPLRGVVATAKETLQTKLPDRMKYVEVAGKTREDALRLAAMLKRMAWAATLSGRERGDRAAINRWHTIMAAAYDAEEALQHNSQAKLVLTDLLIRID